MPAPGTMRPLRGGVHLRGVDHPTSGDRHGQEPGQEEGREEKTGEDAEGKARGEEGEESRPLSRLFLVPRIEGAANVSESAWAPGADALGANRSEEHTSELQSLMRTSYAVFCLKK